jgi:hypothetical protein
MRDAELLLRFLAYSFFGSRYGGNLKKFLDDTTKALNENWDEQKKSIQTQSQEMEHALTYCETIFGAKNYLRKWNGQVFERQKNRAVMDIMMFYFSQQSLRTALAENGEQVVEKFKSLCAHDMSFRASLETTTKSIEANAIRFNKWADALSELSGIIVQSPFGNYDNN